LSQRAVCTPSKAMARFIGKVALVMAPSIHGAHAGEAGSQTHASQRGQLPKGGWSSLGELVASMQSVSGAASSVTDPARSLASASAEADERQLNGGVATTTTQMPGSCAVPALGPGIDASACVGLFKGDSCIVTCASGYVGGAMTYRCDSEEDGFVGVALDSREGGFVGAALACAAEPLRPSRKVLDDVRNRLLAQGSVSSRVTEAVDGKSTVAERVTAAQVDAAGGSLKIAGSTADAASVTVPKALFDLLGDEVVVAITEDGLALTNQTFVDGADVDIWGVVSIVVGTRGNAEANVSGLQEPILITLGKTPSDMEAESCVFYDEQEAMWSSEGLTLRGGVANGPVVCESKHLATFGAILKPLAPTPAPTTTTEEPDELSGVAHAAATSLLAWMMLHASTLLV
jgi:hypothetical protein